MSDAVAKLRFDLLADLGGFSRPMDEAGAAAEKAAQRFNKSFDSIRESAHRAEREMEAWKQSMQKEGSFLAGSMNFGGGESAATKNQVRWAEMLPWGKSARAEITREAAETAATLGRAKSEIGSKLGEAMKGLSEMREGGMGGMMQNVLGMMSAHPVGAVAAAMGGAAIEHVREREQYVRETQHSAEMFGASTEDISRLHGAGVQDDLLSHFQRSIGEGNEGFGSLGLNSGKLAGESLQQALTETAAKFNALPSAAEKARVAQELFGREGQEMIPILQHLKGKLAEVAESKIVSPKEAAEVKASDKDWNTLKKTFDEKTESVYKSLGLSGGISKNFSRGATGFLDMITDPFGTGETSRKHQAQWNREDAESYMADIRAKAEERAQREAAFQAQEADRMKRLTDMSKGITVSVDDSIAELKNPGAAARNRFQREAEAAAGHTPGSMANIMARYDADQERLRAAQRTKAAHDRGEEIRQAGLRPMDALDEERARLTQSWNDGGGNFNFGRALRAAGRRAEDRMGIRNPEEDYANRMADLLQGKGRISAEKLHRAASDAADALMGAIDKPFMTSFERYQGHMKSIEDRERQGSYTHDEAERRRKAERQAELGHAGIRRPEEEFRDSMQELLQLKGAGDISGDEFGKRARELRRQAISGVLSGTEEIHAVGAAAAGSREAYSATIAGQLNSPQTQLQVQANAKLQKIVDELTKQNAKQPIVAEPAAAW